MVKCGMVRPITKQPLNMIKTSDGDRSRHAMLVEQINRLMRGGRAIKLAHVCGEQNGISHYLAAFGRRNDALLCGWDRDL